MSGREQIVNEPLTEKPDPYYIFNILLYMNKLDLFFTFFDGFGVSGIPRITTASEASHELMKSYLLVLMTLLHSTTSTVPIARF